MSHLFGGGSSLGGVTSAVGPAPTPSLPPTMPDPMSPEALLARRKAMLMSQAAGRSSTTLTTPGSTLAGSVPSGGMGSAFASAKLGG